MTTVYQSNAALAAHDRDTWRRQWQNAATTETLTDLDHHLRIYRLIAWVARATDTRPRHIGLIEAGAEIVAAAAEKLGEVER